MAPSIVHLPNGYALTATPVFGGVFFKSNDLHLHQNLFPPGWTIVLNCEDDDDHGSPDSSHQDSSSVQNQTPKKPHVHRFRQPSLRSDHLFISSISNPSSNDFKPATSQTRSIAMMLWASLYWYFHQQEPSPRLINSASSRTPESGRPHGDWRVNINREGIFKGKHLLPKLERMGLIASEDSSVGLDPEDGVACAGDSWTNMFVSRQSFWQLDARIYLFSLIPTQANSPYPSVSPASSRPASPNRGGGRVDDQPLPLTGLGGAPPPLLALHNTPPGPFFSNSSLPTFYPPPPPQYTFTNHVRHPVRPKPPRQGETFYTRFIPSLGEYLSFRVASLGNKPCVYRGPSMTSPTTSPTSNSSDNTATLLSASVAALRPPSAGQEPSDMTDVQLLHRWMNDPRVAHSWGETGPATHQKGFLEQCLASRHSFPVIGCFDGKPFGFFQIYWIREDALGVLLGGGGGGEAGDYDRGLHVLVGEHDFRGPHRVTVWLSALVHYCWLNDARTNVVMMEPRVDNEKLLKYCQEVGFYKEREVAFPHKQSNLLKIRREGWQAPRI